MKLPVAVFAVTLLLGGCAGSGGAAVDPDAVEALKDRDARTGSNLTKSGGAKSVDPTQMEQQRNQGTQPRGQSGG